MASWLSACLGLLVLASVASATTTFGSSSGSSRFHVKRDRPSQTSNSSVHGNRRAYEPALIRQDTGFDPDILNRFLEEYANKLKRASTERPASSYDENKEPNRLDDSPVDRNDMAPGDALQLNDTMKRHKYYSSSSSGYPEDRNSGWVTLDAIPWSKSKISKWQANPTTQVPWPDDPKPWDKPSYSKPWNSNGPNRPSYDSGKPWQNKLTNRPHWSDSSPAASNKPWYPRPEYQDRPGSGYPSIDKYEDNPSQAQKWPPERPSWDRYGEQSSRPTADIITDDSPPNFPNNHWDRPVQRPSYTHHTESYVNEAPGWHDRNDFPASTGNKYPHRPDDGYYDRPHFSHYHYPTSSNGGAGGGGPNNLNHPPSHPSSGDGQWVLLSTNRGYSKTRQRSIKFDVPVAEAAAKDKKKSGAVNGDDAVPALTSKRQVRLTVLPSVNGTNTTTSHGGLLEVERTFKTVEQSQREYELAQRLNATSSRPVSSSAASQDQSRPARPLVMNAKRPTRNTIAGLSAPSNSAVLAAVGAGMLPATMAMMIPMMLGRRRKREAEVTYVRLPEGFFEDAAVAAGGRRI